MPDPILTYFSFLKNIFIFHTCLNSLVKFNSFCLFFTRFKAQETFSPALIFPFFSSLKYLYYTCLIVLVKFNFFYLFFTRFKAQENFYLPDLILTWLFPFKYFYLLPIPNYINRYNILFIFYDVQDFRKGENVFFVSDRLIPEPLIKILSQ